MQTTPLDRMRYLRFCVHDRSHIASVQHYRGGCVWIYSELDVEAKNFLSLKGNSLHGCDKEWRLHGDENILRPGNALNRTWPPLSVEPLVAASFLAPLILLRVTLEPATTAPCESTTVSTSPDLCCLACDADCESCCGLVFAVATPRLMVVRRIALAMRRLLRWSAPDDLVCGFTLAEIMFISFAYQGCIGKR